jgi:hypothetical protein
MLITLGGLSVYLAPVAHIDIDVNPSVGLAVNWFGIVIETDAYNATGSAVLQSVAVKNKTYGEAALSLLHEFVSRGYLTNNGLISATVHGNNEKEESGLLDALTIVVNRVLSDNQISAETDLFSVSTEVMNVAHGHHMTPAKYLAIEKLLAVDPTATFEECAENSVGEIRARIHSCDGEEHSDASEGQHDECLEENETDPSHHNNHHLTAKPILSNTAAASGVPK